MKFVTIVLFFLVLIGGIMAMDRAEQLPVRNKAELGRKLFTEKILSKDSSVSCASCHNPQLAFADTAAFSMGIHQIPTRRNTPSVLNMKNRPYFFWDGRAASLEQQALMPIENKDEMGLPVAEAVARLNQHKEYLALFKKIFKAKPNRINLAAAFAAFERTLETSDSRFDSWANGDSIALTAQEERGRVLFVEKAKCFECHAGEDFTFDTFRNIGLYDGVTLTDKGRYEITKKNEDLGKFKTPGLRNAALTAPYMHNGMFKTLEEVVDYYNDTRRVVKNPINIDPVLQQPLGLTNAEKADLVAFLKTLSDEHYLRPAAR
jgi:cytochrome c peroxidase